MPENREIFPTLVGNPKSGCVESFWELEKKEKE